MERLGYSVNVTDSPDPGDTDFYGTTGFAVTNVALKATKEIKVTDSFYIPIFGQVVGNPCSQKAYLVLGFTLQP